MERATGPERQYNPLLEAALGYAERGWAVFPCLPKGKRPLVPGGRNSATTDADQLTAWWSRWPNANIGIATGPESGLFVLDIDPAAGGDDSLTEIRLKYGNLPDTVMCLTGGGGQHYYFRYQPGAKNTASKLSAGIDTRGDGGYVIAPPSIHENGILYQWECSSDPEDVKPADPPAWMFSQVTITNTNGVYHAGNLGFEFTAGPVSVPYDGEPVPEGQRNDSLSRLVGKLLNEGKPRAEILTIANGWNKTLAVPLPEKEIYHTTLSIFRTHDKNHPLSEIHISDPPNTADEPIEAESGQIEDSVPFPTELLAVPGMVGRIASWITETAILPQPVLALANAIAFCGALVGRKVATESDLRTNFYCLGVGDSGCGKDHSRRSIKRITDTVGITEKILAGEEVTSGSAILESVHSFASPSILFQWDEIGHMVANSSSRKAETHQREIPVVLTKLFSSANTLMIGKEYANRQSRPRKDIDQPNVCIYGTTVPGRLAAGLTQDEIRDGFLGRNLVFISDTPDPTPQPISTPTVPPDIVEWVTRWFMLEPERPQGNIASVTRTRPIVITATDDANKIFERFYAYSTENKKAAREHGLGFDAIWARAAEHARKLSLLLSCGISTEPIIDAGIADFCCRLSEHLTRGLIAWAQFNVSESDYQRNLKRVLQIIRRHHQGVSRNTLTRKVQWIDKRSREAIVADLIEAGMVRDVAVTTHGRSRRMFVAVRRDG